MSTIWLLLETSNNGDNVIGYCTTEAAAQEIQAEIHADFAAMYAVLDAWRDQHPEPLYSHETHRACLDWYDAYARAVEEVSRGRRVPARMYHDLDDHRVRIATHALLTPR